MPRKGHPGEGRSSEGQARGDTMVTTIALTRACLRACQADLGYRALLFLNSPSIFPRIASLECKNNDSTGGAPMSNSGPPAAATLDASVAEQLRQLSTATLTMVLLKRGVRTSWLRGVMPLKPIHGRVVGPAFTIRFVPGREDLSQPESYARSPSFRDAIEAAPAGSVVVIDGRGNAIGPTSWWNVSRTRE